MGVALPASFSAAGAHFLPSTSKEEIYQQWNVFSPLSQRWKVDGDDVQAIEEVVAEPAFAHQLFQVNVGGGDDAYVGLDSWTPPRCMNLRSCSTRRILLCVSMLMVPISSRNSVPRSAISNRPFSSNRAGECALDVPEQSGFEQVGRHGTGIHRDKRPIAPRRIQVDGLGDQFLAGSALTLQEYSGAAGRHLRHQIKNLQHGSLLPTMFSKL